MVKTEKFIKKICGSLSCTGFLCRITIHTTACFLPFLVTPSEGTYYVKEKTASPGYGLCDGTDGAKDGIHKVTVEAGKEMCNYLDKN